MLVKVIEEGDDMAATRVGEIGVHYLTQQLNFVTGGLSITARRLYDLKCRMPAGSGRSENQQLYMTMRAHKLCCGTMRGST